MCLWLKPITWLYKKSYEAPLAKCRGSQSPANVIAEKENNLSKLSNHELTPQFTELTHINVPEPLL